MKRDILKILCCPTCKGELELKVDKEKGGDIIDGVLTCKNCKVKYPIKDGIPDLLPR